MSDLFEAAGSPAGTDRAVDRGKTSGTPARVLRSLGAAMRGLAVGTFASALPARVELR